MKRNLLLLIILFIGVKLNAQKLNQSYLSAPADSMTAGSLLFSVSNNDFLKNNEYFNPYTEGITWFGSMLQPEIHYAFSSKTRLSAGWFLRYYYGKDKFNASLPVFRFDYDFLPGARLTFGQLPGLLDHQLIEPIYSNDNYFKRNPENGIQFQLTKPRLNGSLWISWEHFLLPGENRQEEILAGFSGSYLLFPASLKRSLSFNFQGIIHHFGGQVDFSGKPLETRLNLAPGIEYTLYPECGLLSKVQLASYFIQSADQSFKVTIPYKKGFASYSYLLLNRKWLTLAAAYFHGEYYFAPVGDNLFQSVSELNNWYSGDYRDLLNGKLMIDREITKGVKLGIRFESYYDLAGGNLDFCYGMNLKADVSWLLKKGR